MALDDLSYDMTTIIHQSLSHASLHPPNLGILPGKKSWLLNLDIMVLSDSGNIYDALFMAARSALWDTKVPRTKSVQYQAKKNAPAAAPSSEHQNDVEMDLMETPSNFDTRQISTATDFELPDYWDEGEPLGNREQWPVCVTMNIVRYGVFYRTNLCSNKTQLAPPKFFVDATLHEEASTALRLLLLFSFPRSGAVMQTMRLIGDGELQLSSMASLLKVRHPWVLLNFLITPLQEGEIYANEVFVALESKLHEEDVRRNQKARMRFGR